MGETGRDYMSIELLEIRLRRAERWIILLGLALAVALAAIVFLHHRPMGALRATTVELLDANGNPVAVLGAMDGRTGLFLLDEELVPRVSLFHAKDADGLYIDDGEGATRIGVAQFAHGGGGLALHGPGSLGATVLYYKEKGSLRFFDRDGNVVREISGTGPQ